MLSLAQEFGILQAAPRIKLRKENERTAIWDADMEARFLKVAPQPCRDVFLICQDSGRRPDEVICFLWDKFLIFIPRARRKTQLVMYG
jgi:hypothetical protein